MATELKSIMKSEAVERLKLEQRPRAGPIFGLIIPLLTSLALLLLAIGLVSSWIIKRMAEDYSSLIAQTALDLDRLHDISYHAGIGSATAIELVTTSDPSKRAAMLGTIADERWANSAMFEEMMRKASDKRLRAGLEEVLAKRAVFTNRTDEFIQNASTKPYGLATTNCLPVLESFVAYQKAVDSLSDLVRATSLQASAHLTRAATRFRFLLFAAGVLPILLGLLAIAGTLYLMMVTPHEVDLKS
jgi:Four helix bundle sensory module for signal transduction